MLPASSPNRIPIYNFQHEISSHRSVRLGPFTLRIDRDEYLDTSIFSTSGGTNFSNLIDDAGQLARSTSSFDARQGRWAVTAVVDDHPLLSERSGLFPEIQVLTGKDDLGYVLWFLTGREVAIGAAKNQQFMIGGTADRLVSHNYFYLPSIDWAKISNVAESGASNSLYAICLALSSRNELIKISVSTSALDSLVSRWYKSNCSPPSLDELRSKFVLASAVYRERLTKLGVSSEQISDVVARIPNLVSDASALAKLRAFLSNHQMLDTADPVAAGRVKMLNTYRNAVAHQAKIPLEPNVPFETGLQVAGAVSALLIMICRVFIAKYLIGIDGDDGVEKDQECVYAFFKDGTFRGQDVFNESYTEFIRRAEESWILNGELPV